MSAQAVIAPAPPTLPAPKISVQAYLAMEREAEFRHEYVRGEVIEKQGATPKHNRLAMNFALYFDAAFADCACEVYSLSIRLRVAPDQYRYPDVMALREAPQFDEEVPPSLLNPAVIIEMLSPAKPGSDQGDKFFEYQQITGLKDYIAVAQENVLVTHCVRRSATEWKITQYSRLAGTLTFASVGVTMSLRDIYRRTPLAASEDAAPAETSG